MKLATLKDGTRDGQLIVVSRDLQTAVIADAIAPTLQRVIEDWTFYAPQLQALYERLNTGRARRVFGFDPHDCMAPLPRAYRLLLAVDDDRPQAGATVPTIEPLFAPLAARRADTLLGPHDDVTVDAAHAAVDFRGAWAAILDDIAPYGTATRALDGVRLLMLGSVFARAADAADAGDHGHGARGTDASRRHSTPAMQICGFSPVAVTPDEYGDGWQVGRLSQRLDVRVNGRHVVAAADGPDLSIVAARAAAGEGVSAGTIVMSSALPADERLAFGDRVRVDAVDRQGQSICGVIEQSVAPLAE